MKRSASIAVCFALATTCLAQGKIWIVDAAMGPGAQFKDIPAAVAKALDGDKIIVRKGKYTPFTLSRGVTIIGQSGVTFPWFGVLYISNLPAGRTAAVHNIQYSYGLSVNNCKGRVICERLGMYSMSVTNSPQVYLLNLGGYLTGTARLSVTNSRVIVTKSRFGASTGGTGVVLRNSNVTMAGCFVTGGQWWLNYNPAIGMDSGSVLTLTDDGLSVISVPHLSTSVIVGAGTVVLDPRVVLKTASNIPAIASGIKVTRRTVPYLDARGAPLGGTVNVTLKAGANHPFFLAIGLPGNVTAFPSLGGSVWLDLNTAILIATGKLDSNGAYAWASTVPRANVLFGLTLVWQGTAGPSLRQQWLSNPSAYVHGL